MVAAQEEAALLVLVGDEKIEDFGGLTPAIGIVAKKDKMVGGLTCVRALIAPCISPITKVRIGIRYLFRRQKYKK